MRPRDLLSVKICADVFPHDSQPAGTTEKNEKRNCRAFQNNLLCKVLLDYTRLHYKKTICRQHIQWYIVHTSSDLFFYSETTLTQYLDSAHPFIGTQHLYQIESKIRVQSTCQVERRIARLLQLSSHENHCCKWMAF